jgi:nucleotide-binding universal stress UspA family protein
MKVLVGIDFSRSSEIALEEIARRPWPKGTEFFLVTIVEPLDLAASQTFVPEFSRTKAEAARVRIEQMAPTLAERGWAVSSRVLPGHPRSSLNTVAESWKADLVVVGSRGRGPLRRLLLGSVAAAVVRGCPSSVEIVRQPSGGKRKRGMRLLVATDGSPCSLEAARSTALMPWPAGSRIRVVSVAQPVGLLASPWALPSGEEARLDKASEEEAGQAVEAARGLLARAELALSGTVLTGDPRRRLIEDCRDWQADLVIVGSHGRHGMDRLLLGSVSEAVAVHAPCSVEIIRPSSGAGSKAASPA